MSSKTCYKCLIEKEENFFTKSHFSMKEGWCKSCTKEFKSEWKALKAKKDPSFLLRKNISSFISKRLRKNKEFEKGSSIIKYLPYTIQELEKDIEGKFFNSNNLVDGQAWMGWHNYGKYNQDLWDDSDPATWTWQLGYEVDADSFVYDSFSDPQFLKCWSLSNIKPIPSKKNFKETASKTRYFTNLQYNLEFPKDYYNKIICGDSLSIMKKMPDKSVDVIVTSPPYNLGIRKTSSTDKWNGKWNNSKLQNEGYDTHSDYMPEVKYCEWQKNILNECLRLIKDTGAIFYNHKWRVQDGLLQQRSELINGLPLRQIIIWKKAGGLNFNEGYFLPTYEVIYLIVGKNFKLAPKSNILTDVWEVTQEKGSWHPAPFPLEIAKRCISSCEGEVVLDPFMGSGTVGVAALEMGRIYIGIDISQEYCNKAEERLRLAQSSSSSI